MLTGIRFAKNSGVSNFCTSSERKIFVNFRVGVARAKLMTSQYLGDILSRVFRKTPYLSWLHSFKLSLLALRTSLGKTAGNPATLVEFPCRMHTWY